MQPDRNGQVLTFYSYKGGTGRSMALANVAWILASNRKKVLAIDWDLEAPGLHRYFHPFLLDKHQTETDGVIDFCWHYAMQALDSSRAGDRSAEPDPNIGRYAVSLDFDFDSKGEGSLDLVGPGRQSKTYSRRVNAFDWTNFYTRLNGGAFLARMRQRLKQDYDYILIDSRTGVSDTSGICTIDLPDRLACFFTLNNQSIFGAASILRSIVRERGNDGLRIFPVMSRVEGFEQDKLERAQDTARKEFGEFLPNMTEEERDAYWGDTETLYKPWYAYEEVLATFGERSSRSRISLLAPMESITSRLTDREVMRMPRMDPAMRKEVLAKFAGVKRAKLPDEEPVETDRPVRTYSLRWLAVALLATLAISAVGTIPYWAGRGAITLGVGDAVIKVCSRGDATDLPEPTKERQWVRDILGNVVLGQNTACHWALNVGGSVAPAAPGTPRAERGYAVTGGLVVPWIVVFMALLGAATSVMIQLTHWMRVGRTAPADSRNLVVFGFVVLGIAPVLAVLAFEILAPSSLTIASVIGFATGLFSPNVLTRFTRVAAAVQTDSPRRP